MLKNKIVAIICCLTALHISAITKVEIGFKSDATINKESKQELASIKEQHDILQAAIADSQVTLQELKVTTNTLLNHLDTLAKYLKVAKNRYERNPFEKGGKVLPVISLQDKRDIETIRDTATEKNQFNKVIEIVNKIFNEIGYEPAHGVATRPIPGNIF